MPGDRWWSNDEEDTPAPAAPQPDWVAAAIAAITGQNGGDVAGGGGEIGRPDMPRQWDNTNMPPAGQPGYQEDPFAATPWGDLPPGEREAVTQGMVPYGQVHPDYRDQYQRNSPDSIVEHNDTGYRFGDTNLPPAGGLGPPRSNPAWDDFTMYPQGAGSDPFARPSPTPLGPSSGGGPGSDYSPLDWFLGVGRAEAAGPQDRANALATIRAPMPAYDTATPRPSWTPRPTMTPRDTATPYPTRTPFPTNTPRPALTPVPGSGGPRGSVWDAALAATVGSAPPATATPGPAAAPPVAQPPNPNESPFAADYRGAETGMPAGRGPLTLGGVTVDDLVGGALRAGANPAQMDRAQEMFTRNDQPPDGLTSKPNAAAATAPASAREQAQAAKDAASKTLNEPVTRAAGSGTGVGGRTAADDKGVPLAVLLAAAGAQGGQGGLGQVGRDMTAALNTRIGMANDMPGAVGEAPTLANPKGPSAIQIPQEFLDHWDQLSPRVQETILQDVMTRRRQMEQTAAIEASQQARDAQFNRNGTGTQRPPATTAPPRTGGGGGGRGNAAPAPVTAPVVPPVVPPTTSGALPQVTRYTPNIVDLNSRNGTTVPVDVMLAVIHSQSKGDRNFAGSRGSGLSGAPNTSYGAGEDRGDPNTSIGKAMTTLNDLYKQTGDWTEAYRAYLRLLGMDTEEAMADFRKNRQAYLDYFNAA